MNGWLLDTNILSELIRERPDLGVAKRARSLRVRESYASVITLFELRHGAMRHADSDLLWANIQQRISRRVNWLGLDFEVAVRSGDISADLHKRGLPIGSEDCLIGATALVHDLVLVTRNIKHFERIEGLQVENWLAE